MNGEHTLKKIVELLHSVPKPPEDEIPSGAPGELINRAEYETGISFSDDLKKWLSITNGPCVGPGGLFGIYTKRENLDIIEILKIFPRWKVSGWIPVAGDGCGNYYITKQFRNKRCSSPVYFIDAAEDECNLTYVVSSSIWLFLSFLLNKELGERQWPFQETYVVCNDPDLLLIDDAPLPWNSD